jgi:hypothetical protein
MMMIAGPRFVSKFWKAVMVTVLIAAIYPAWFAAGNWFSDAGSGLIQSIAGNPGAHHAKLLIVPNIHNVLGAIFGLLFLLLGGGILLAIFFLYELLLVVATVIGLPLLALSPLSDSFRRKFEQMIVLVFVTSFFGRLAAVAILSVGTQFVKHVTVAHNAVGAVFTLVATLALAIYSQWWLLRKADQIYGNVTGRTLGISKVTGVVESIRRPQRREADMSDIQAAHLSALTPAVVPSPSGYRMGSSAVSSTTSDPTSAPRVSTSSHEGRWAAYRNRRKNTTD